MDIQIILLWIGLFITFVLGLVNFLWGPAILVRREKVAIVNPKVCVFFLSKDQRQSPSENIIVRQCECDALSIDASIGSANFGALTAFTFSAIRGSSS